MLVKISPPEWGTWRAIETRTDTPTYYHVSADSHSQVIMRVCVWFGSLLATDDHCRVRLSVQNSLPHSDYINANFVPVGFGSVFLMFCAHLLILSHSCSGWRIGARLHLYPGASAEHRGRLLEDGVGAKRQGDRHGDGSEAQRHGEEGGVGLCPGSSRLELLICLSPSGSWERQHNPQWP